MRVVSLPPKFAPISQLASHPCEIATEVVEGFAWSLSASLCASLAASLVVCLAVSRATWPWSHVSHAKLLDSTSFSVGRPSTTEGIRTAPNATFIDEDRYVFLPCSTGKGKIASNPNDESDFRLWRRDGRDR